MICQDHSSHPFTSLWSDTTLLTTTIIHKYSNQKWADFGQLEYSKKLPYCVIKPSKTKAALFSSYMWGSIAGLKAQEVTEAPTTERRSQILAWPPRPPFWVSLEECSVPSRQDWASPCSCCSQRIAEEKGYNLYAWVYQAGDNHPGSREPEIRFPLTPQGRDFVLSFRQANGTWVWSIQPGCCRAARAPGVWHSKGTACGTQELKPSLHKWRELKNRSAEGNPPARLLQSNSAPKLNKEPGAEGKNRAAHPSPAKMMTLLLKQLPRSKWMDSKDIPQPGLQGWDLTDPPLPKAWPWAAVCAVRERNPTGMNGRQERD